MDNKSGADSDSASDDGVGFTHSDRGREEERPQARNPASGGSSTDDDALDRLLCRTSVASLTEEQKEILRGIKKVHDVQKHYIEHRYRVDPRHGGLPIFPQHQVDKWRAGLHELAEHLSRYASLAPSAHELKTDGLPNMSDKPGVRGTWWPVVRALGSRKPHYQRVISECVDRYSEHPDLHFLRVLPDLNPASGGQYAMSHAAFQELVDSGYITDAMDFVKNILSKHDGEARLWHPGWRRLHDPQEVGIADVGFWNYQYCKTP